LPKENQLRKYKLLGAQQNTNSKEYSDKTKAGKILIEEN